MNLKGQVDNQIDSGRFVVHADAGTILVLSSATLNLEVKLGQPIFNKVNWYARAGFGGSAIFYGNAGFGGLAGVTMFTGQGNHHFEASAGAFVGNETGAGLGNQGLFALPLLDVGYRFQKPQKSFVFRAKLGVLGLGIGLGYAF